MKFVLLGATGQLGREWQYFFRNEKVEGTDDVLIPYSSDQLDITDKDLLTEELRKQQPDIVINCAAYTDVDGAEENKELTRRVNTEAVEHLSKLSSGMDFQLVHYSTDYVFQGNKKDKEKLPGGYTEDHPADPINWYGRTKWEGEQAIRQTSGNHLILRLSWLCGQFGQNFVKTMLRLGRERNTLQVVNDQWGSPTFTYNVVMNTLQLLKVEATGTFHITSTGLVTWYNFAKKIFEYNELDVNVEAVSSEVFSTKAERPHFSKLNTDKLESISDSMITDWKEGLRDLLTKIDN